MRFFFFVLLHVSSVWRVWASCLCVRACGLCACSHTGARVPHGGLALNLTSSSANDHIFAIFFRRATMHFWAVDSRHGMRGMGWWGTQRRLLAGSRSGPLLRTHKVCDRVRSCLLFTQACAFVDASIPNYDPLLTNQMFFPLNQDRSRVCRQSGTFPESVVTLGTLMSSWVSQMRPRFCSQTSWVPLARRDSR